MEITEEENKLLQELLIKFDMPIFDLSRHVTANMLADELGISSKAASNKLYDLYKHKKIGREKVRRENGYVAWGYFILD